MRAFIGLGGNCRGRARDVRRRRPAAAHDRRPAARLEPLRVRSARPLRPAGVHERGDRAPDRSRAASQLLFELKRVELPLGRDPQGVALRPAPRPRHPLARWPLRGGSWSSTSSFPHPRLHERRFALEPLAELDPGLRPWRGCADLRADVTVADLLADRGGSGGAPRRRGRLGGPVSTAGPRPESSLEADPRRVVGVPHVDRVDEADDPAASGSSPASGSARRRRRSGRRGGARRR